MRTKPEKCGIGRDESSGSTGLDYPDVFVTTNYRHLVK